MGKSRIESKRHESEIEVVSPAPARHERSSVPTEELRAQMVSVAAYFIAQKRSFVGGCAEDDWYAAEAEIDRCLAQEVATATARSTR